MIPIFTICSERTEADNRILGDKFRGADAFPALPTCRPSLIGLDLIEHGAWAGSKMTGMQRATFLLRPRAEGQAAP
jgi:hypothetical protein